MNIKTAIFTIACLSAFAAGGWFSVRTLPSPPPAKMSAALNVSKSAVLSAPQMSLPPFEIVDGESVVQLSGDVQRAAQVKVVPLKGLEDKATIDAAASVIDLQPLFDLRSRLTVARDALEGAGAAAQTSREQFDRTKVLFAQKAISQREFQLSEAAMKADRETLEAATASHQGLVQNATLHYGPVIADALTAVSSDIIQNLLAGTITLYVVSLPGDHAPAAPAHIKIKVPGWTYLDASLLSPSPRADPVVQGQPYFYIAKASIPVGIQAIAKVPVSDKAMFGVLVPDRSIVWYAGLPWVYVKTDPEHFTRRLVADAKSAAGGGTFAAGKLRPGDMVVVSGAQLLLSQELKPRDITQQCPDPPECDG